MGIDLGSGEGLMSQKFLHASQIRSIVQHVCGKAVTQGMWADRRIQSRFPQVLVHFPSDAACAESMAVLVGKQYFTVKIAVVLHSFVAELDIPLNGL